MMSASKLAFSRTLSSDENNKNHVVLTNNKQDGNPQQVFIQNGINLLQTFVLLCSLYSLAWRSENQGTRCSLYNFCVDFQLHHPRAIYLAFLNMYLHENSCLTSKIFQSFYNSETITFFKKERSTNCQYSARFVFKHSWHSWEKQ